MGCLTFPHDGSPSEHSIVHQLYNSGQISFKQFYLELNVNNENEFLYLGGIPHSLQSRTLNKGYVIPQQKRSYFWNFGFNKFSFGNNSYNIISDCEIQISYRYFYIDNDTYNKLIKENFEQYIEQKQCSKWDINDHIKIHCVPSVIKDIPTIKFHFNNFTIDFKKEFLFDCFGYSSCELKIEVIKTLDNSWRSGYLMLKDFVTGFDYENEVIVLLSKIENWRGKEILMIKMIIMIIIMLNLVGIFMLGFFSQNVFKKNRYVEIF